MTDWLKSNSWALIMITVSLVASYAVSNYKMTQIEERVRENDMRISAIETSETAKQVTLAQIQKDIEFIRYQLSKLVK